MKRVFTRPVLHVLPLAEGIDAQSLASLSSDELARVYEQSRAAESEVMLRAHPDVIARQIGDEWILVPTGDFAQHFNGMVSLNEFGYFIWQQFQTPCTIGDVLRAASAQYGDSRGMQDIEIRQFVADYVSMGLFQKIG